MITFSDNHKKDLFIYKLIRERVRLNDFEGIMHLYRIFPEIKTLLIPDAPRIMIDKLGKAIYTNFLEINDPEFPLKLKQEFGIVLVPPASSLQEKNSNQHFRNSRFSRLPKLD